MDSWSNRQLEIMKQGGNGQLKSFFSQLNLENSPISSLYITKGAYIYRKLLVEKVDSIFANINYNTEGNISNIDFCGGGSPNGTHFTGSSGDAYSESPGSPYKHLKIEDKMVYGKGEYLIEFDKNSLGMTLEKNSENEAAVSRVIPGSSAALKGVRVGDIAVAVMGKYVCEYDDIMHMIMCMPRPVLIAFRRHGHGQGDPQGKGQGDHHALPLSLSALPQSLPAFREMAPTMLLPLSGATLDVGSLIGSSSDDCISIINSSSSRNFNRNNNSENNINININSSSRRIAVGGDRVADTSSSASYNSKLEATEDDDSLSLFAGLTIRRSSEDENEKEEESTKNAAIFNAANVTTEEQSIIYTVAFSSSPLGLTLNIDDDGGGDIGLTVVSALKMGGRAQILGKQDGIRIIDLDS